jgi:RHS repeat-associated protein
MPLPKSVTSPAGSVTTYASYDPVGAAPTLVSLGADGSAPVQTYSIYNADGRVQETGKPNLAATQFQYAVTGRVTSQSRRYDGNSPWVATTSDLAPRGVQPLTTVGPRVKTVTFANPQGDLVWKSEQPVDGSQPARFTCFNYDGEGHLLETILPEGNSIINTYDSAWRLVSVKRGMRGQTPTDAWTAQCASNTSTWTGQQDVSASSYGPGGFLASKTVQGITTSYVTDGFGRQIEERDALNVRRRGYDRQGRVVWEALMQPSAAAATYAKPQPDPSQVVTMTEYGYDHLGRTTSVTRWHVEDKTSVVKTTTYNDAQRTVSENDAGHVTTTVMDGAGRPVSKTLPDGSTVAWSYSGNSGSVITRTTQTNNPGKPSTVETTVLDGMGFTKSLTDDQGTLEHAETHDIEGHLLTTTDLASSALTEYGYDGFGRLLNESKRLSKLWEQTARYSYDRNNRRTTVTDARGNTTSFHYDELDRLVGRTDPTGKATSFAYSDSSTRIATQQDPSGTLFQRSYDQLGRVSLETATPPAGLDLGVRTTNFGYDAVGHLNKVVYGGPGLQGWDNTVSMTFDSFGRKVHETNSLFAFGVDHSYDLDSNWKTTTIAGATEQQSFDALGRLAGVSLNGASLAVYHYGAAGVGGPLAIDYQTGTRTTFGYDKRNRQTDLWVTQTSGSSTNTLLSLHTALGADGIPRERMHSIGPRTVTNAFQVDYFGRVGAESLDVPNASSLSGDVTNQSVAGWMQAGARFRSYGLDGVANWQVVTDSQAGSDSPVVDARNAYTTFAGKQPLYDAADNAISIPAADGDEAYTWDVYKHPLTAAKGSSGASFVYDGLGRRILEHDASGVHFLLWDGARLAARGDSRTDASQWTLEVGGADIDDHVASVSALGHGPVHFYHQTVDGSVIGMSDASGLLEGYTYSAYGELSIYAPDGSARTDSVLGARFLYHGQLYDPWTKTYSMRAREYRPAWGRFLSTDPIGLDGGLNLYAFVNGSPLHMRDPMGTDARAMSNLGLDPSLGTPGLTLDFNGILGSQSTNDGDSLDGRLFANNSVPFRTDSSIATDAPSGPSFLNPTAPLASHSYWDLNVTATFIVGPTGGFFIDQNGYVYAYLGFALATPGLGLSGSYGLGAVSPGTWQWQLSVSLFASESWGSDWGNFHPSPRDQFVEGGIASSIGASLSVYYTFETPVYAPTQPNSWRFGRFGDPTDSVPWTFGPLDPSKMSLPSQPSYP